MLTLASRLFFFAAIALLVWAGVLMVVAGKATPARKALIIEEPEQDVGQLAAGKHIVSFRVRNTTERPQRIIGMTEG